MLLLSNAVSPRQPWDSSLYLAAVSPSTLNWKILSAGPTAWKSWAGLSMGLSVCGESGFIGLWNSTLLVESFVSPRLATGYSQGTRMTDCHERWFSVLHVSRLLRHEWFSVGLFLISRIPRGDTRRAFIIFVSRCMHMIWSTYTFKCSLRCRHMLAILCYSVDLLKFYREMYFQRFFSVLAIGFFNLIIPVRML